MAFRGILFLMLVCIPLPCFAQGGAALGLDVPLTGSASDIGHYLLWGVEIAIDEANAEGGALGKPIRLVVLDDEMDPARAAANITRLIEKDHVSAVLGPANSGNALAFIPLLQKAKIPNMLLTASATKLTRIYENEATNYIFRATLPDREQVQALISWAAARYKNIAIACDTSAYAQLGKEDMLDAMRAYGLEPAAIVEFDPGELDLTSQARHSRHPLPRPWPSSPWGRRWPTSFVAQTPSAITRNSSASILSSSIRLKNCRTGCPTA